MAARWIDAHCHLADPRLGSDAASRLEAAGVGAFLQGGVDPADWERQRALTHPGVLRAFGLHPWAVTGHDDAALTLLERLLPEALALGETGLDASMRFKRTLDAQRAAFAAQLALAKRLPKPLVLHAVGAHEEVLETLRREGPFPRGGLVHGFTGDAETAAAYAELRFMISVGHRPCPALETIPGGALLIESDADRPGRDLVAIARGAAEIRGESAETLLDRSAANLRRLLEIS